MNSMFRVFQRHFTKSLVVLAKKEPPKCPSKKPTKMQEVCKPTVEACKTLKLPLDACQPKTESKSRPNIFGLITLFFCVPLIIIYSIKVLVYGEVEGREPFVKYDYMRIRKKPFPWGDGNHSLFHNPCYNALPDGYEDEKCDDELLEEIKKKSGEIEE